MLARQCRDWESRMKTLVARFARDESGRAAIEYGVIAAAIGVAIVSILGQISGQLNTLFDGVESDLKPKAG
jgi:pilus assembly protein Flp/PilA